MVQLLVLGFCLCDSLPVSWTGGRNSVLLAGAFHAEVTEGRNRRAIDNHLTKIYDLALQSDKDAEKLVTAGVIPSLILLLKARAVDFVGLEIVLITLGVLAYVELLFSAPSTLYLTSAVLVLIDTILSAQILSIGRILPRH
jgi:hypothetical protein